MEKSVVPTFLYGVHIRTDMVAVGGRYMGLFYHGMIAVSYIIMSGSGWQTCLGGSDMN